MKQQMKKMVQKGKQQMLLAITGVLLLTAFTPYPTNAQYILVPNFPAQLHQHLEHKCWYQDVGTIFSALGTKI